MPATQQEHPVLKGECPCAIARRVGCLVGDIGPLIIGDCLGGSDLKRSQVDGHRPAARVADPNETTLGDAVWYVPAQRTCGQGERTGGDGIPAGATVFGKVGLDGRVLANVRGVPANYVDAASRPGFTAHRRAQ